jgi:hypothetical protein
VSDVDRSTAYAVGRGGTVLRWNGSEWSNEDPRTTEDLYAVWADASEVYAVGGLVCKYAAGRWTTMRSGIQSLLLSVHGGDERASLLHPFRRRRRVDRVRSQRDAGDAPRKRCSRVRSNCCAPDVCHARRNVFRGWLRRHDPAPRRRRLDRRRQSHARTPLGGWSDTPG